MDVYKRLQELGIQLPKPPARAGTYRSTKFFAGNLLYVSGCGPKIAGQELKLGRLGAELTVEEGQQAARATILNVLCLVEDAAGDLNKVKSFVKLLGFVASSEDFFEQPSVMNGATQLLVELFGEDIGLPARSAIGVNVLPGNIPVEIEAIVEISC